MKQKWLWISIIGIFFIGFTGFVIGFGNAFLIGLEVTQPASVSEEVTETTIPPPEVFPVGDFQVVALGDSLARGTGDSAGGFVERTVEGMEAEEDVTITLYNFSNEGMRSGELAEQIKDPLLEQAVANARYLVISIGGNDLRDVRRTAVPQQDQVFERQLNQYLEHLEEILERIRRTNEQSLIIFLGLYNLQDNLSSETETGYLLEWNYRTQQALAAFPGTLYIPTLDLFQLNFEQFISFDRLHPSEEGHEAIARRILDNL